MNNLGALYSRERRFPEAEALFVKVLDARKRILGLEHQNTLNTMTNLAQLYDREGKSAEAERAYVEVLGLRQRVMGKDHPDSRQIMNNLGLFYFRNNRQAEAESMFRPLLEIKQRKLGNDHPDTLKTADNLAILYLQQRRFTRRSKRCSPIFSSRTPTRDGHLVPRQHRGDSRRRADGRGKRYPEAERLLLDGYQRLVDGRRRSRPTRRPGRRADPPVDHESSIKRGENRNAPEGVARPRVRQLMRARAGVSPRTAAAVSERGGRSVTRASRSAR